MNRRDEIYHLRRTLFFADFFLVGRSTDVRWTAVGWSSDGHFRTIKYDEFQKFKFQILNFKFQISIGQGWGPSVPFRPSEPSRPSPGQLKFEIWNLKFEIWIFENFKRQNSFVAFFFYPDGRAAIEAVATVMASWLLRWKKAVCIPNGNLGERLVNPPRIRKLNN